MKKQLLMILLLVNLFNTSIYPIGLSIQTKDCLKNLVPLNIVAGLLGYICVKIGEREYNIIEKIRQNPINNIEIIKNFAANYKKTISLTDTNGKRITGQIEDNSLSLALINAGNNESKLKEVILYINNIMKRETTGLYFVGYVIPALALIYSVGYIYDKYYESKNSNKSESYG